MPVIDPSLYIHRFAARMDLGEKTHTIAMTAIRLVARMKRDWIQTGRRPAGICGVGLLIASRMHGFRRTRGEVMQVVRVTDLTLRNRLAEFGNTEASQLTAEEFLTLECVRFRNIPHVSIAHYPTLTLFPSATQPKTFSRLPTEADPPAYIRGVLEDELAKESALLEDALAHDLSELADDDIVQQTGVASSLALATLPPVQTMAGPLASDRALEVLDRPELAGVLARSHIVAHADGDGRRTHEQSRAAVASAGEEAGANGADGAGDIMPANESTLWKARLLLSKNWGRAITTFQRELQRRQKSVDDLESHSVAATDVGAGTGAGSGVGAGAGGKSDTLAALEASHVDFLTKLSSVKVEAVVSGASRGVESSKFGLTGEQLSSVLNVLDSAVKGAKKGDSAETSEDESGFVRRNKKGKGARVRKAVAAEKSAAASRVPSKDDPQGVSSELDEPAAPNAKKKRPTATSNSAPVDSLDADDAVAAPKLRGPQQRLIEERKAYEVIAREMALHLQTASKVPVGTSVPSSSEANEEGAAIAVQLMRRAVGDADKLLKSSECVSAKNGHLLFMPAKLTPLPFFTRPPTQVHFNGSEGGDTSCRHGERRGRWRGRGW